MKRDRPKAEGHLQFENERVIVTEWRFAPGAETGWHKHGFDYVVVPGRDGQLLIESVAGAQTAELRAGQSYARTRGVEHNVVNANEFAFSFVEIELK